MNIFSIVNHGSLELNHFISQSTAAATTTTTTTTKRKRKRKRGIEIKKERENDKIYPISFSGIRTRR